VTILAGSPGVVNGSGDATCARGIRISKESFCTRLVLGNLVLAHSYIKSNQNRLVSSDLIPHCAKVCPEGLPSSKDVFPVVVAEFGWWVNEVHFHVPSS